jgi:hypothetical protein
MSGELLMGSCVSALFFLTIVNLNSSLVARPLSSKCASPHS